MLVIRDAQRHPMGRAREDEFVTAMVEHLKRRKPARADRLGDDGLHQVVHRGLELARQIGVKAGAERSGLVELVFDFGLDPGSWPESGTVQTYLAHPTMPAEAKVRTIRSHLDDRLLGREVLQFNAEESRS